LEKLSQKRKFNFLITNLRDESVIKAQSFAYIGSGEHKVFILGILDPKFLTGAEKDLFTDPIQAIKKVMGVINKNGYDEKNPLHRLILLSHSGREKDYELAKRFPSIDWIIGAHDQSFTKTPLLEGKTKVVQTLSRNHYLGHIHFDFKENKDTFELIEVKEGLEKELSPNPFEEFIRAHKIKMRELQELEQSEIVVVKSNLPRLKPARSCIECHQIQGEHWKQTAHSMAFLTLIKSEEEKNLNCLGCHTLGLGEKRGYFKSQDLVSFKDPPRDEKNPLDESTREHTEFELRSLKKRYWRDIEDSFKGKKAVRDLKKSELLNSMNTLIKIDEKYKVTHNFTGIQCLNCHSMAHEHPFEDTKVKFINMKARCLKCHNAHQTPAWYQVKDNGLPGELDEKSFNQALREVGCPKGLN